LVPYSYFIYFIKNVEINNIFLLFLVTESSQKRPSPLNRGSITSNYKMIYEAYYRGSCICKGSCVKIADYFRRPATKSRIKIKTCEAKFFYRRLYSVLAGAPPIRSGTLFLLVLKTSGTIAAFITSVKIKSLIWSCLCVGTRRNSRRYF